MDKPLTVLQRVERLERFANEIDTKVDSILTSVRNSLTTAMEVVDAMVTTLSSEMDAVYTELNKQNSVFPTKCGLEVKLETVVKEKRQKVLTVNAEKEKEQLDQMVKLGVLKMVDVVGPSSLMVCRLFDKEGNLVGAGRNQIDFMHLTDEAKPKMIDQGVGFVLEMGGEKLEVIEIYETVPQSETKTTAVTEAPTVTEPVAETTTVTEGTV